MALRDLLKSYFNPVETGKRNFLGQGVGLRDIGREGVYTTGRAAKTVLSAPIGFAQSIRDSVTAPYINRLREREDTRRQDTLRQMLQKAKTTDPRRRQALLRTAQSLGTNTINTAKLAPSINKTKRQVIGEAAGTAAFVAPFAAPVKTALGASLIPRTLTGTGLGAVGGGSYAATQNKSNKDIAKASAIGGVAGGTISAAAPYVAELLKGRIQDIPDVFKTLPAKARLDLQGVNPAAIQKAFQAAGLKYNPTMSVDEALSQLPYTQQKQFAPAVAIKQQLDKDLSKVQRAFTEPAKQADDLLQEARKYKTPEEFIKAKSSVPSELSYMAKQAEGVSYETFKRRMTSNIGSVDKGEIIPDDTAAAVFKRLQKTAQRGEFGDEATLFKDVGGRNPKRLVGDEQITVYRATPVKNLRAGDFVSPSKSEAGFYTSATKKVYPFKVKKADLVSVEGSMGGEQELIYIPKGSKQGVAKEFFSSPKEFWEAVNGKTKSQLTDIWNKAQGGADNLINEARKYKTPEEFIKAQTNQFHGTKNDFQVFDDSFVGTGKGSNESGFWFTSNKKEAEAISEFTAKGTGKPRVIETAISPNKPKIVDLKGDTLIPSEANTIVAEARKSGHDAVVFKNVRVAGDIKADHTVVLDNNIVKTKSQLTDIYNQASKAPKTVGGFNLSIPTTQKGRVASIKLADIDIDSTFADSPSGTPDAPVVLRKLKNGKYEVWDGMHRLARQLQEGTDDVQAVIIDPKSKTTIGEALASSGVPTQSQPARAIQTGSQALSQPPVQSVPTSPAGLTTPPQSLTQSYGDDIAQQPDAVKKVIAALERAKPVRNRQEALYSKEMSRRVGRLAGVQSRLKPGEQGYYQQLGQLKGPLPKADFESIRGQVTQDDVNQLYQAVRTTQLTPLEKVNAETALTKLLAPEGGQVPTKGEIRLLREVFPKEFIDAIQDNRGAWAKAYDFGVDLANVPRAIQTTADLSAAGRQGVFNIGRKEFWKNLPNLVKYAFSDKAYQQDMAAIKSRPTYGAMRQAGLSITDLSDDLTMREERFMSTLPEKIPGIGKVVKGSSRSYTGFLNSLRADMFDDIYGKAQQAGVGDEALTSVAKFVNAATGRGDLGGLARASRELNAVFFSPRLLASRLNLMNPMFYAKLEPTVRREALKTLASFVGIGTTVLAAADLVPGVEVVKDPRNSDFAKIKIGNTRYDVLGGFQQPMRTISQFVTGEHISSTSGRLTRVGEGYKPLTRLQILTRFFESKEAPIPSLISTILKGQNFLGQPLNLPAELANRVIPMVLSDAYDAYKETGDIGIIMALPAFFGTSVQTYGREEPSLRITPTGQKKVVGSPVTGLAEDISNYFFPKKATANEVIQETVQMFQNGEIDRETAKGRMREALYADVTNQINNDPQARQELLPMYVQQLKKDTKSEMRRVMNDITLTSTQKDKEIQRIIKNFEKAIKEIRV